MKRKNGMPKATISAIKGLSPEQVVDGRKAYEEIRKYEELTRKRETDET